MVKHFLACPIPLYFIFFDRQYIWVETSCNRKVTGLSPATADVSITNHLSCQNVLEQKTGPLPVHSL